MKFILQNAKSDNSEDCSNNIRGSIPPKIFSGSNGIKKIIPRNPEACFFVFFESGYPFTLTVLIPTRGSHACLFSLSDFKKVRCPKVATPPKETRPSTPRPTSPVRKNLTLRDRRLFELPTQIPEKRRKIIKKQEPFFIFV